VAERIAHHITQGVLASDALRACAAALESGRTPIADVPRLMLLTETGLVALRQMQLAMASDYARAGAPPIDFRSLLLYPVPKEDDPR
jgi:hypothetical protein